MNKIGTLDIIKAYLGNKELSSNNAYIGEIPLIKGSSPEPLDKDYFYLQPLSTGNYSISTGDEVWKQKETFEFRLDKTNWRKFSSLSNQESYVGFVEYMANNPDLVALALDINAYNTLVVGQHLRVGISQMGPATVATFLGTDENFAYYVSTLKASEMMRFQWVLMEATSTSLRYRSNYSRDRMFEWDGSNNSGTNTNTSKYSAFNVVTTIITETIPLAANDKLYLRNTGGSIHNGIISSIQNINHNIGGILNTLTDYTDDTYTITNKYAYSLFNGDTKLISAGDLKLPATTLADDCYINMFNGCTSLTTAPELPATTLAGSCYNGMFNGCTSLTTAPELPATTLAGRCYNSMFGGCTSLTTTPALPATTLANYCYSNMFSGCTSLTTVPVLLATTLAGSCYYSMFYGCTSLTTAPELPTTTLAVECYSNMFSGCTSLTTAPELPATTLANFCYSNMFSGCTSLTTAPELPATTLANFCYSNMFSGCTSLTTAPELPATTLAESCYNGMFLNCSKLNKIIIHCTGTQSSTDALRNFNKWVDKVAATGDFYNLGKASFASGANGIPSGWTVHTSL